MEIRVKNSDFRLSLFGFSITIFSYSLTLPTARLQTQ